MKKILLAFFLTLFLVLNVQAKASKQDFSTVIEDSGVDINSIAVSIKNVDSGKVVYALNDKTLMNPASLQKVLTTPVAYENLGEDYLLSKALSSIKIRCAVDSTVFASSFKSFDDKYGSAPNFITNFLPLFIFSSKSSSEKI